MRVMLNRHPHIAAGPEGKLLDRTSFVEFHEFLEREWLERDLVKYEFDRRELDEAIAAFIDNFFTRYRLRMGKPRWAEKTPGNIRRIDYLFRLFPHAQFIHMIRDPRDVYCSLVEKKKSDPKFESWTVTKMANRWVECIEAGIPWRLHADRYLEVKYEDLMTDPENTMHAVLRFLHEPWDACVLDSSAEPVRPNATSNTHRPLFSASVARWRHELSEEDLRFIEETTGPWMHHSGYQMVTTPSTRSVLQHVLGS
jgi:hypothetical protein